MEKDRQEVTDLASKVETVEANLLSLQQKFENSISNQGASVEQVKEVVLSDVQNPVTTVTNFCTFLHKALHGLYRHVRE